MLVPELLLIGQLIDRSGMAWCISAFGREEMAQIAIEEWASSSPVYTRRMQQALGYEGTDIYTIFKGLQLDIGAPPQFMDFRYTVHDRWHGEFHLDHCGALMDVEPMGPEYVRSMCHDIEDPTFDATAVATNPKAQVRPIHRPPRTAGRPQPALRLDRDHRRVAPAGGGDPCAGRRTGVAGRDLRAGPDRPGRRRPRRLLRPAARRPRLRRLLALRAGADRRRGLPADAPAQPGLPDRAAGPDRAGRDRSSGPSRPSSWSASPALLRAGSTGRWARRTASPGRCGCSGCTRCSTLRRTSARRWASRVSPSSPSPAREDGGWITFCGPDETRPLQAIVQAVDPVPRRRGRRDCRRLEPGRGAPRDARARARGGRGHRLQHRRDLRVRGAALAPDHPGLTWVPFRGSRCSHLNHRGPAVAGGRGRRPVVGIDRRSSSERARSRGQRQLTCELGGGRAEASASRSGREERASLRRRPPLHHLCRTVPRGGRRPPEGAMVRPPTAPSRIRFARFALLDSARLRPEMAPIGTTPTCGRLGLRELTVCESTVVEVRGAPATSLETPV